MGYLIRRRARAFQRKGDYARAAAEFSSLIKGDDWQALDYIERGCAFLGLGKPESAIADFTKAIERDSANDNSPSILTILDHPHLGGDYDQTADIDKAIALNPDLSLTACIHRGNAWLAKGEPNHAIADFSKAIAISPHCAPAHSGRGRARLISRDRDRAIIDFTKAARLNSRDAFTQKELAEALHATHLRAATMKNMEIFQSLIRLDRVTPTALIGASKRRSTLLPLFFKEIKLWLDVAGDMIDRDQVHTNDITAILCLLGEWQEQSAYQPLIRILRHSIPEGGLRDLAGGYHSILAAVYDGNPLPLFDLARHDHSPHDPARYDRAAQEPRIQAFLAISLLTAKSKLDKQRAKYFFRDSHDVLTTQYAWHVLPGWAKAIAIAGLSELAPLVQDAYTKGLVRGFAIHEFQDILTRAVAQPWDVVTEYARPINSIEAFSKWIWR